SHETATPYIYTLSLHDALPICADHVLDGGEVEAAPGDFGLVDGDIEYRQAGRLLDFDIGGALGAAQDRGNLIALSSKGPNSSPRSEEHTSELQSRSDLVCRLLL